MTKALWPALGDLALNAQHVAHPVIQGIQTEANQKFVKAYNAKYKQDPDVSAELGYDNGKAIMLTLEKLGGVMPEDRTKFISTMRDLTFDAPARQDQVQCAEQRLAREGLRDRDRQGGRWQDAAQIPR